MKALPTPSHSQNSLETPLAMPTCKVQQAITPILRAYLFVAQEVTLTNRRICVLMSAGPISGHRRPYPHKQGFVSTA
jgi:hypothetical protein